MEIASDSFPGRNKLGIASSVLALGVEEEFATGQIRIDQELWRPAAILSHKRDVEVQSEIPLESLVMSINVHEKIEGGVI